MHNLNTTLAVSGTLEASTKVQYLCTLVHGEVLCQFDLLSTDVESVNPITVENIHKGLTLYVSPVSFLSYKIAQCIAE